MQDDKPVLLCRMKISMIPFCSMYEPSHRRLVGEKLWRMAFNSSKTSSSRSCSRQSTAAQIEFLVELIARHIYWISCVTRNYPAFPGFRPIYNLGTDRMDLLYNVLLL
ncbi:hypothetical protein Droror1_Dr00013801 [Drosera rotundifolia]